MQARLRVTLLWYRHEQLDLQNKSKKVFINTRSPAASQIFNGLVSKNGLLKVGWQEVQAKISKDSSQSPHWKKTVKEGAKRKCIKPTFLSQILPEIPIAHFRVVSLSKRGLVHNHSYENSLIWIIMCEISFFWNDGYKRKTLFEKEAESNLDLAYLIPIFYFYFLWYLILVTQSHQLTISKWICKELGMHV